MASTPRWLLVLNPRLIPRHELQTNSALRTSSDHGSEKWKIYLVRTCIKQMAVITTNVTERRASSMWLNAFINILFFTLFPSIFVKYIPAAIYGRRDKNIVFIKSAVLSRLNSLD